MKIEAGHQGMAGFDDSFIPPDPKPILGEISCLACLIETESGHLPGRIPSKSVNIVSVRTYFPRCALVGT